MGVHLSKTYKRFKIGMALVTGATADTNITVTGIKTTDELVAVYESAATSALFTDRTSTGSV